jgi:hypothetical protein
MKHGAIVISSGSKCRDIVTCPRCVLIIKFHTKGTDTRFKLNMGVRSCPAESTWLGMFDVCLKMLLGGVWWLARRRYTGTVYGCTGLVRSSTVTIL